MSPLFSYPMLYPTFRDVHKQLIIIHCNKLYTPLMLILGKVKQRREPPLRDSTLWGYCRKKHQNCYQKLHFSHNSLLFIDELLLQSYIDIITAATCCNRDIYEHRPAKNET